MILRRCKVNQKLFAEIKRITELEELGITTDNQEDFIREFQDKVNWSAISCKQTLSENFIREFQNKVDWCKICYNQTLSKSFKKEFKKHLKIRQKKPKSKNN